MKSLKNYFNFSRWLKSGLSTYLQLKKVGPEEAQAFANKLIRDISVAPRLKKFFCVSEKIKEAC